MGRHQRATSLLRVDQSAPGSGFPSDFNSRRFHWIHGFVWVFVVEL